MIQQDSTKVTFTQVYGDLKGALEGAAEALKTGSEHVYAILVRQQVVNAITYSLLNLVMAAVTIILLKKAFAMAKDKDGDWPIIFKTLVGIFMLISISIFCITIGDIVMGFLNPEYGAIQEVREFIKN